MADHRLQVSGLTQAAPASLPEPTYLIHQFELGVSTVPDAPAPKAAPANAGAIGQSPGFLRPWPRWSRFPGTRGDRSTIEVRGGVRGKGVAGRRR